MSLPYRFAPIFSLLPWSIAALAIITPAAVWSQGIDSEKTAWPQFRGVNSSGIATGPAPPIEFGPGTNELWQTPVAAGHSSPVIR